jgi:hypothetical protein
MLISATVRRGLARSLRKLIEDAQHPVQPLDSRVPICRRKILNSRKTLEELADRLVSRDPVDACGVAHVRLVLTEGWGPLYDRPGADDFEPVLRRALRALEVTV